jgi:DNA-directed RNA polymerase specialized sigma24 family protein
MFHESSVERVRAFYDRWSRTVFRFCQLFVGDKDRAEKATQVAFLNYFRAGPDLDLEVVPIPLLRQALHALRSHCGSDGIPAQDLGTAILCLPFEERSVFILRSVLDFDFGTIAEVTARKEEQVKQIWLQGICQLREFLPREFFKERTR